MKWIMVLLVLALCGCSEDKPATRPNPAPPSHETKQQASDFVQILSCTVKFSRGDGANLIVGCGSEDYHLHCVGNYQEEKCNDDATTTDCISHHTGEDWCYAFKPGEMLQLEVWGHEKIVFHSTTSKNEYDYEVP